MRALYLLSSALALALALLFISAQPSVAQPTNPPTEIFDVAPVTGQRKYAAWSARNDIKVFRTATQIVYTLPDGGVNNQPRNVSAPVGSLLLLGGNADVWISTNGFNWFIVAGPSAATYTYIPTAWKTTYSYEVGQSICKARNTDRIYIMRDNRLWFSDDAKNFTYILSDSPNRWYYPCVVDDLGTIYSIAGDSTYASTDGGRTWIRRSVFLWSNTGRVGHAAEFYYSNQYSKNFIFAMGGGRPANNDVWVTSDGAYTWTLLSSNAAWPARYDARLGIASNGVLIIAAGRPDDTNVFNDVWTSLDGGYNWWLLRNHASFTPRILPATVVDSEGYYWIFGGLQFVYIEDGAQISNSNSIVRSTHKFSNVLDWLPKVNRNSYGPSAACLGLTCWPNSTCAPSCTVAGDFNFVAAGFAPYAPRYALNLAQLRTSVTYKVMSNGAQTTRTFPSGSLVVFGGIASGSLVDGWVTSDNSDWTPIYGASTGLPSTEYTAPPHVFGQVGCSSSVAGSATTMYLVGGGAAVHRSTDGGQNWTPLSTQINGHYYGSCVVLPSSGTVLSFAWDVAWRSTDSGATFTLATTRRPGGRAAPFAVAYRSQQLQTDVFYLMGGVWSTTHNSNDVLVSVDAGATFLTVTSAAAWPARADGRAVVHSSGILAIFAGQAGNFRDWFNDAWFSADGGYRWFELTSSDAITSRNFPATILSLEGTFLSRIISTGGNREVGGYSNDVYISQDTFLFDQSILTWGEQVAPPFAKVKPSSSCLGLACLPNITNCACRASSIFNLVPTGYYGGWTTRYLNALSRLTNSRTYRIMSNGAEIDLVMPANSWIQFGGGANDVWVSSNKGQTWHQIAGRNVNNANAAYAVVPRFQDSFTPREAQTYCFARYDDKIYAMGGKNWGDSSATSWSREIWSSTDGQDWIIAQDGSADGDWVWPGRAYFLCSVDTNLALYATGGNDDSYSSVEDDTFVSVDGGVSWDKVRTTATYPGRASFFGGEAWGRLLGKSLIYAIGGVSFRNYNDVWVTSDGAKTWVVVSGIAPWAARTDTYVAFADDGAMVLHGGQANGFDVWFSDVWMSLDGGYNWWEVTPNYGAWPRTFGSSLIDEQGFLYVIGGNVLWNGMSNEILRSTLSFSNSAVNTWGPPLISGLITPTEFGLACWPGQACSYTVYTIPPPVSVVTPSSSSTGGAAAASSSTSSLSGGSVAGIVIGVLIGAAIFSVFAFLAGLSFAKRGGKSTSSSAGTFQPHQDVELESSQAGHVQEETA